MKKQDYTMSLNEKIEMLRMGVRAVTRGYKTSRLIMGSVGIGKSFAVVDELQKEGVPFTHITGGIKDAQALYVTLCKYNDPNMIIVFDDVNDIIRKKLNVEILRAAVTNEPVRRITYFDQTMLIVQGTKSFKPTLDFQSKVILITNIPKNKIDPAIVSRTSPIEIIVSPAEIAPYIEDNLENAPPAKVPVEWKYEAWHYITKEIGVNKVKRLDFRVFEDVMLWVCASKDPDAVSTDWKKYAYSILM